MECARLIFNSIYIFMNLGSAEMFPNVNLPFWGGHMFVNGLLGTYESKGMLLSGIHLIQKTLGTNVKQGVRATCR